MLFKVMGAVFVMMLSISLVAADEFFGAITNVKGESVTIQKYKKGEKKGQKGDKDGEPVTMKLAKDAKVLKGKKGTEGEAIEEGLKNEMFSKASSDKGVPARITTNTDGDITSIVVFGGGKRKTEEKKEDKKDDKK